jgi:hypothetical protein
MQKELIGLNKLNELNGLGAFAAGALRIEDEDKKRLSSETVGMDDLKGLGLRPHMQLRDFLMKFWGRKDGQFRSGGLLVGDRPFFVL